MSKRENRRAAGSSWRETGTSSSLLDVALQGYGLENIPAGQNIIVKSISIFEILPDANQPRQVIPSVIFEQFGGSKGAYDPVHLLKNWCSSALNLDIPHLLETTPRPGGADEEFDLIPETLEAQEVALLQIVLLAASILRDGLTNPITLLKQDSGYLIETGERRWLAYHLLNIYFDDEQWQEIPARVMDEFNIWRQAAENSQRDNLNAISRARQLALLLMDMHGLQNFRPLPTFEHEQDFYAQVNELSPLYGQNERILKVMGVEHRNAISRYKALLKLPRQVWIWANDNDWAERALRKLTNKSDEQAIKIAQSWLQSSPMGDDSKTEKLSPVVTIERSLNTLDKLSQKKIQAMDSKERQELQDMLATYRRRLEEIESWL